MLDIDLAKNWDISIWWIGGRESVCSWGDGCIIQKS